MWRLWTRGWGIRAWWYWFTREGFPMFVAWHLPHQIALWTFIRVYAKDGQSPGPDYGRVYDAWERSKGQPRRPARKPASTASEDAAQQRCQSHTEPMVVTLQSMQEVVEAFPAPRETREEPR